MPDLGDSDYPAWPYDWQSADSTLDPHAIRKQGEFWLHRALNTRRPIAFVGSGVSAAYGRVTWAELALLHMKRLVLEVTKRSRARPAGNTRPAQKQRRTQATPSTQSARPPVRVEHQPEAAWDKDDRSQSRLIEALKGFEQDLDRHSPGDKIMLVLHLCEQLWALARDDDPPASEKGFSDLAVLARRFHLSDKYLELRDAGVKQPELGPKLFRTWVKRETHDELPHVLRVLTGIDRQFRAILSERRDAALRKAQDAERRAPRDGERAENAKAKAQDLLTEIALALVGRRKLDRSNVEQSDEGQGGNKRIYAVLFKADCIEAIGQQARAQRHALEAAATRRNPKRRGLEPRVAQACGAILKAVDSVLALLAGAIQSGRPLAPIRHFALGFCLDLLRVEARLRCSGKSDIYHTISKTIVAGIEATLDKQKKRPELRRRDDVIPAEADPIRRLAFDLGIRRFATTNYDLEFERFFHDFGFGHASDLLGDARAHSSPERFGPKGGRTRDFVLNDNTAADLIDFATNEGAYSFELVHLHGRATDDEQEDIVVTERDYQARYLRDSAAQAIFHEGREVTFGGNPILFVGQGMSEGDVLRPLREFVGGSLRRNPSIVAFRPVETKESERNAFTMEQYTKYGAHIIHYGFGTSPAAPFRLVEHPAGRQSGRRRAGKDDARTTDGSWLCRFVFSVDDVGERVKKIEEGIEDLEKAAEAIAGIRHYQQESLDDSFKSDGGLCDVTFELRLVNEIIELCVALSEAIRAVPPHRTARMRSRVPQRPRKAAVPQLDKNGREALFDLLSETIPTTLDRTRAAVLTAALNAKLEGVRDQWTEWWRKWQTAPTDRTLFLTYKQANPKQSAREQMQPLQPSGSQPGPIWTRHLIRSLGDNPDDRRAAALKDYLEPKFFEEAAWVPKDHPLTHRRCFMIVGPRGAGKGNLYTHLANTTAISKDRLHLDYIGQYFTSFSFTCEVASIWDTLPVFLLDPAKFPPLRELQKSSDPVNSEFLSRSRMERLEYALARYKEKRSADKGRALIAFNAFELLFQADGKAKQGEIGEFFDILLRDREMPIDLLLILRHANIPAYFRSGENHTDSPATHALLPLLSRRQRSEVSGKQAERVLKMLQQGQAHCWPDATCSNRADLVARADAPAVEDRNFIHVLDELDLTQREGRPRFDFLRSVAPTVEDIDCVLRLSGDDNRRAAPSVQPAAGAVNAGADLPEFFSSVLRSNRFALTLVVLVAQDICNRPLPSPTGEQPSRQGGNERQSTKQEKDELRRFLDALRVLPGGSAGTPPDQFFESILDYWYTRRKPQQGANAPSGLGKSAKPRADKRNKDSEDAILDDNPPLDESLIRHLAVIGTPTDARTLSACPQVAEKLRPGTRPGNLDEAAKQIDGALERLFQRGLVFRINPLNRADPLSARQKEGPWRYQVHRLLQMHLYRRLGSQESEPPEGYIFGPSLFAAQTRDYPRLHAAAYAFLYELVDSLIDYPSERPRRVPSGAGKDPVWIHRGRCLRAALGVTRTLLSIGTVVRFAEVKGCGCSWPRISATWNIIGWRSAG